jgi:hypothetical protein
MVRASEKAPEFSSIDHEDLVLQTFAGMDRYIGALFRIVETGASEAKVQALETLARLISMKVKERVESWDLATFCAQVCQDSNKVSSPHMDRVWTRLAKETR